MSLFGGLKDKLYRAYARHSQLFDAAGKFLLCGGMCILIREAVPFHALLSNLLLLGVISAIAMLLPLQVIPVIGAVLITAQSFALDIAAGGAAAALLLVFFLLFFRFVPDDTLAAVLTPMAMFFGLDPFIPICCGLRRSPASVFAVCPGAVVYAFLRTLSEEADVIRGMETKDYAGKLQLILGNTFTDSLVVIVLGMAACLVTVYAVRCLSADYAPYLGILLGGLVYILFLLLGRAVLNAELYLPSALVGTAAAAAAAYLLLLFWMPLRYAKSEYLRFEDDDYYYYVKAIPKAHGASYPGESASFREVPNQKS